MIKHKTLFLLALLICSLLSVSAVSAGTFEITKDLELDTGTRYSCYYDDDILVIDDSITGGSIFLMVTDADEAGITTDLLKLIFMDSTMLSILYEDVVIEEGPFTTGELTWFWGTLDIEGTKLKTAPSLLDHYLLHFVFLDFPRSDAEQLFTCIHFKGEGSQTAQPSAGVDAPQKDYSQISGYYDARSDPLRPDGITLILSPRGFARLSSSDESVVFAYSWDGKTLSLEEAGVDFILNADGSITMSAGGNSRDFIRRENPEDPDGFAGSWEISSITTEGVEYDRDQIEQNGHIILMTVNPDGTIDWQDGEDQGAQGWGRDKGVYTYFNGNGTFPVVVTGSEAKFFTVSDGEDVVFTFVKSSGSESDTGSGSGGKILF